MAVSETLTLYGRSGCHHCEQLQFALDLMKMRGEPPGLSDYRYIDIDSDRALTAKYNHLVPVLMFGEHTVCEGVFDIEKLTQDLNALLG